MYYIKYFVSNFNKEFTMGPYSKLDVEFQKNDISSFEGVYNVRIVEECNKENISCLK
jgi:hypothetical protein